ncbi:hypothetical protein PMAYCL1PPCAC_14175 [Pristionchus mayeri]|uniref:Uncharacterized protein n=1 Tax=Pristionchus mayeri TaxID=1317129 RepID=A0AAN4ZV18_9BILA|nr:hypothetical protein PMAYCL1PPCAC_14175 [Pristionchus mayeri]
MGSYYVKCIVHPKYGAYREVIGCKSEDGSILGVGKSSKKIGINDKYRSEDVESCLRREDGTVEYTNNSHISYYPG